MQKIVFSPNVNDVNREKPNTAVFVLPVFIQ